MNLPTLFTAPIFDFSVAGFGRGVQKAGKVLLYAAVSVGLTMIEDYLVPRYGLIHDPQLALIVTYANNMVVTFLKGWLTTLRQGIIVQGGKDTIESQTVFPGDATPANGNV